MRIGHITDVHGDFGSLDLALVFLGRQNLDLIVSSGDFLGPRDEGSDNGETKYRELDSLLRWRIPDFENRFLAVPGNWDTEQFMSIFPEVNLHPSNEDRGYREVSGLRIAGYGLIQSDFLDFSDEKAFEHLMMQRARIVVTHTPPQGMGITEYLVGVDPKPFVLFCGHNHSSGDIQKDGPAGTVVVESGTVGRIYANEKSYGTFTLTDLDLERGVEKVTVYKVEGSEVECIREA